MHLSSSSHLLLQPHRGLTSRIPTSPSRPDLGASPVMAPHMGTLQLEGAHRYFTVFSPTREAGLRPGWGCCSPKQGWGCRWFGSKAQPQLTVSFICSFIGLAGHLLNSY